MSEVIRILKRIDGRTVYQRGGALMVRFDSEEDRERFETACRLLDCVQRQDIKAAARVVFEAVTEGPVADENDLLDYIDDDDAREIIRLELAPLMEDIESALVAQILEIWPEHDR